MKCPFCNNEETSVKDSRSVNNGTSIKRRRFCDACGGKFTTFEIVQLKKIKVIKKSGESEDFDRNKVWKSVNIATRKRPISQETIETVVNNIICNLEKVHDMKITTKLIGELIMEQLSKVDKVAFIRFASVYLNFNDEKDFTKLINNIESTISVTK
jgi:transcriptional repressor NrdR